MVVKVFPPISQSAPDGFIGNFQEIFPDTVKNKKTFL